MTDLEKYNAAFTDSLDVKPEQLDNLKYHDVPGWDSIGHMVLVDKLEEEFDVQFDTNDIIGFDSYRKGLEILKKMGKTIL